MISVIVPIYKSEEQLEAIKAKVLTIKQNLEKRGVTVKFDDDDTQKPGWKFAEYELKGVPVRLAIGPRDLENGTVEVARRDTLTKHTGSITVIFHYFRYNHMTGIVWMLPHHGIFLIISIHHNRGIAPVLFVPTYFTMSGMLSGHK